MKKFKMILIAILFTVGVVGCSNSNDESTNNQTSLSAKETMDKIQEVLANEYGVELQDGVLPGYMLSNMTNKDELGVYADHFNTDDIEEGYMLAPLMNVKSSLIMVIKAKDENSAKSIKEGLDKVLSDQEVVWSTYLPDQYELVQNNQIKQQGNYLLYVTSDATDQIVKVFEESVR